MTLEQHLLDLEPDELIDVWKHWTAIAGRPPADEEALRTALLRAMTERSVVSERHGELADKPREFLLWLCGRDGHRLALEDIDTEAEGLPVESFEVESLLFALRKRGFVFEAREKDWLAYGEPVFVVPAEIARIVLAIEGREERSVAEHLSLRAWINGLSREELEPRLARLGLAPTLAEDRTAAVARLTQPDMLETAVASLEDENLRFLVDRLLDRHGGVGERRHLERMGLLSDERPDWGARLEEACLGTMLSVELTDSGLTLGPGSVVLFPELVVALLETRLEREIEEEPEAPADVLADLAAMRTFVDHHAVRMTRDGALYRATARKLEGEVLGPGTRGLDPQEAIAQMLRFATECRFARSDASGRLRTTDEWSSFEEADPVQRTEEIANFVRADLHGTKGAIHMSRLRRLLLSVIEKMGRGRWTDLRSAALIARNRYLQGFDTEATAERFQRRYKYAPIPELVAPAVLARELEKFAAGPLAWSGMVVVAEEDGDPVAVRLTRLGALVLGVEEVEEQEPARKGGALIVTADFEIVVFPEVGGITLVQEIGRFARRKKADYSMHFRIEQDSIHQAVARGLDADAILELLDREGRHPTPSNVSAQIRSWASEVKVLAVRRSHLLRASTAEQLDQALKIPEIKAVAGERLNATTLELIEDPSSPRIAAALRGHRFFLS